MQNDIICFVAVFSDSLIYFVGFSTLLVIFLIFYSAIAHSPKCEQVRYVRSKEDLRYIALLRQVGSLTGKWRFFKLTICFVVKIGFPNRKHRRVGLDA
jgi:hypothetical protein